MKVVIAGATGYIGQEILSQCLANPSITSVFALNRRPLDIQHEKLTSYTMSDEDFLTYSNPTLLEGLKGASACLWTIGVTPAKAAEWETTRKVSVDYVRAAVEGVSRAFGDSGSNGKGKLRFVFISGGAAERDQERSLWFWGDFRRIRGESENILFRHEEANKDTFEPYIMRIGLVASPDRTIRDRLAEWGFVPGVKREVIAKAMIDVALNGYEENTLSNQTIREFEGR